MPDPKLGLDLRDPELGLDLRDPETYTQVLEKLMQATQPRPLRGPGPSVAYNAAFPRQSGPDEMTKQLQAMGLRPGEGFSQDGGGNVTHVYAAHDKTGMVPLAGTLAARDPRVAAAIRRGAVAGVGGGIDANGVLTPSGPPVQSPPPSLSQRAYRALAQILSKPH